ncbi:E3 ubiquitin-protein ligase [Pseudoscourfieldia marina]
MALVYSSSPMSVLPEDSEDTPAAKKQTSSDAVDKGKQQLVPPPQTKVAVVVVDEPSTPPLPIKQKPTSDDDGNLRGAESSSEASSSQKSLLDADNDAEEVPRTSSDSERGGHFSVFGGLSDSPPPSVRPEQAGGAVPMPTLPESLSSERLAEKEANDDDDDDDDDENEASPSSPPSSSTQPTSPAVNSPTKKPNLSLFQKTLELTAGDEHIKELEESECCSICLDDFTDDDPAKVTLCGHRYHLQCVMQWRQRSDECPMCLRTLRWVDTETEELVEALAQPEFVVGSAPDYTTDRSTGYALMAAYASSRPRPRSLTTTTATTRAPPSRGAFAATLGIPRRRATETAAPSSSSSLSSSAPAKGFFGKMSAMFRSRR